jgi:hypothetical protein
MIGGGREAENVCNVQYDTIDHRRGGRGERVGKNRDVMPASRFGCVGNDVICRKIPSELFSHVLYKDS